VAESVQVLSANPFIARVYGTAEADVYSYRDGESLRGYGRAPDEILTEEAAAIWRSDLQL
jgi:hypothetical protein